MLSGNKIEHPFLDLVIILQEIKCEYGDQNDIEYLAEEDAQSGDSPKHIGKHLFNPGRNLIQNGLLQFRGIDPEKSQDLGQIILDKMTDRGRHARYLSDELLDLPDQIGNEDKTHKYQESQTEKQENKSCAGAGHMFFFKPVHQRIEQICQDKRHNKGKHDALSPDEKPDQQYQNHTHCQTSGNRVFLQTQQKRNKKSADHNGR